MLLILEGNLNKHNFNAEDGIKHHDSIQQFNQSKLKSLLSGNSVIKPSNNIYDKTKKSLISNKTSQERTSRAERNERMSKSRERLAQATSPTSKYIASHQNPSINHNKRKEAIRGKPTSNQDEQSFLKEFKDFNTDELLRRRKENEAYLEEIEKSIYDNIESTQSLINDSMMHSFMREDRPLSMESSVMSKSTNQNPSIPIELTSAVTAVQDYPIKLKSSHTKASVPNKNKLNYHKHKPKPGPQKMAQLYESSHYNSWEAHCQDRITPTSLPIEPSTRRMDSIKK